MNQETLKRWGRALRIQAVYTETAQGKPQTTDYTNKQSQVNHKNEYLGNSIQRGSPTSKNPYTFCHHHLMFSIVFYERQLILLIIFYFDAIKLLFLIQQTELKLTEQALEESFQENLGNQRVWSFLGRGLKGSGLVSGKLLRRVYGSFHSKTSTSIVESRGTRFQALSIMQQNPLSGFFIFVCSVLFCIEMLDHQISG